jgi:hypothetical protein
MMSTGLLAARPIKAFDATFAASTIYVALTISTIRRAIDATWLGLPLKIFNKARIFANGTFLGKPILSIAPRLTSEWWALLFTRRAPIPSGASTNADSRGLVATLRVTTRRAILRARLAPQALLATLVTSTRLGARAKVATFGTQFCTLVADIEVAFASPKAKTRIFLATRFTEFLAFRRTRLITIQAKVISFALRWANACRQEFGYVERIGDKAIFHHADRAGAWTFLVTLLTEPTILTTVTLSSTGAITLDGVLASFWTWRLTVMTVVAVFARLAMPVLVHNIVCACLVYHS